jgi:hypothetical protein
MKKIPDKLVAKGSDLFDEGGRFIASIDAEGITWEEDELYARIITRRYNLGARIEKEQKKNRKMKSLRVYQSISTSGTTRGGER